MNQSPTQSRQQATRVTGLCILAFLLMVTYSISRPAIESLFLAAHTSEALPAVWMTSAAGVAVAVWIYNRFVGKIDLIRLYGIISGLSGLTLALLVLLRAAHMPGIHYALYVWKDVYVVVLLEVFYSYADAVFPIHSARWYYGLFGGVASLGSMCGNLAVGPLSIRFGTGTTLLFAIPVFFVLYLFCLPLARAVGSHRLLAGEAKGAITLSEAFETLRKSHYLTLILVLIILTQVVITLIDFQFNAAVEQAYPVTDARTGVIGQVYAVVSFGTIVLHALTGPALHLLGVPLTLLMVPVLLGAGLGVYMAIPLFVTMAAVKAGSKLFDYSIFRSAKEILYIPLTYLEKTSGKSIVDMMGYRVAKGGASLLLLVFLAMEDRAWIPWLTLLLVAVWMGVTGVVAVRFRARVSREEEMAGRGPDIEISCASDSLEQEIAEQEIAEQPSTVPPPS